MVAGFLWSFEPLRGAARSGRSAGTVVGGNRLRGFPRPIDCGAGRGPHAKGGRPPFDPVPMFNVWPAPLQEVSMTADRSAAR